MGAIHEIVFDCDKPAVLAKFWAALLDGYQVRAYDDVEIAKLAALGFTPDTDPTVMVDGPGPSLCFQNVEGRRHDNNRVHFDVDALDRPAEVDRLKGLGATVDRVLPTYTVMKDPEGNQFCLVDRRQQLEDEAPAAQDAA